jgi:hypothetical protein
MCDDAITAFYETLPPRNLPLTEAGDVGSHRRFLMCHVGFLIPLVLGLIALRVVMRVLWWRRARGYYGGGGGGCGRMGWHARWRHGWHGGPSREEGQVFVDRGRDSRDVEAAFASLDLSSGQRDQVAEVFEAFRDAGYNNWNGLIGALVLVTEDRFDAIRVAGQLGPMATREMVDALEHVHNILLDEQRAALAAVLRKLSM